MNDILKLLASINAGRIAILAGLVAIFVASTGGVWGVVVQPGREDPLFWVGASLVAVGLFFEWVRAAKQSEKDRNDD